MENILALGTIQSLLQLLNTDVVIQNHPRTICKGINRIVFNKLYWQNRLKAKCSLWAVACRMLYQIMTYEEASLEQMLKTQVIKQLPGQRGLLICMEADKSFMQKIIDLIICANFNSLP